MKMFKSKIEKLAEMHERLLIERQEVNNNLITANSKIETKIKKLEFKSYINKEEATKQIAIINRRLRKLERDIENEKEFASSLEIKKAEDIVIKEV